MFLLRHETAIGVGSENNIKYAYAIGPFSQVCSVAEFGVVSI